MADAAIRANGLVKDYGDFRALCGIDFEIAPGECFGFLGTNGAGKTTATKIICCYMPPSGGSVSVLGMDVTRFPSQIKARIGVLPQDDNPDVDLSVMQNLVVYARYFGIRRGEG
ncbi:MAG: ATP-binding cassette domain-containing protein, partial [Myxococcota bacterium]